LDGESSRESKIQILLNSPPKTKKTEMNIPKETIDRESYIKNIIIPDDAIDYIGKDFTDITFKFKTNTPIEYKTEFISVKNRTCN